MGGGVTSKADLIRFDCLRSDGEFLGLCGRGRGGLNIERFCFHTLDANWVGEFGVIWCYVVLFYGICCYAVLFLVILCYLLLCCVILCYLVLWGIMWFHLVLFYVMLCYVVLVGVT